MQLRCKPNYGVCQRGVRSVPIELLDVAGLVPGAHMGKGLGNKFLDDLRHANDDGTGIGALYRTIGDFGGSSGKCWSGPIPVGLTGSMVLNGLLGIDTKHHTLPEKLTHTRADDARNAFIVDEAGL